MDVQESSARAVREPAAASCFLATPLARALLVASIVVATLAVHGVAIESGFKKDDFLHLYDRASLGYVDFVTRPHGGHVMIAHKLLLDGLLRVFGLRASAIFAVFLLLHVVNAVLLNGILVRFTGRPLLSLLITLAWSTAPIHQPTIAWISTHGHVLVGTFLLLVLREISGSWRDGARPSDLTVLRWSLLLAAAVCSFGVGLSIAAGAPLWVWLLSREGALQGRKWIYLSGATVFAVGAFLFARSSGGDVTQTDVVAAMPSVGLLFTRLAAYGLATTAGASVLTLRSDDVALWPLGELGMDAALAIACAVSLVLSLFLLRAFVAADRGRRRLILGCVLVSCAAYGAVALGRGSFLLGKSPEWFATRAKYHYASPIGFLLAIGIALSRVTWRVTLPRLAVGGALVLGFVITGVLSARRTDDDLAEEARSAMDLVDRALGAAAQEAPAGVVYVDNAPFLPARHIMLAKRQESELPGIFAYCAIAHPDFVIDGREVCFVERDAEIVQLTRERRRTNVAEHLVTPREALERGARAVYDVRAGRTRPVRPAAEER